MLASMSADTVNWSDLGVNELPTGTVTLLLADIEGSTRLWETQPEQMASAVARLDRTLGDLVTTHHGVRPIEQGEGDSFVIAFSRAADAVACAVDLQRAPLQPIRLRIGMHTGDVQLRDPVSGDANYVGPAINRAGRLRDLAHGDRRCCPARPRRWSSTTCPRRRGSPIWAPIGFAICRARSKFCSCATRSSVTSSRPYVHRKLVQYIIFQRSLTSFIGRGEQLAEIRRMLGTSRLVTLTGAGGVGKTRLAIEVAGGLATEPTGALWFVDLAPIADSDIVAIAAARALGLPDQPGRSTTETLVGFIGDRQMLIVLDNCEHLLDATAALVGALLSACAGLRLLVTSREPIGVAGEAIWRVPSLSLNDEAVDLFVDRARLVRPEFRLADQRDVVCDICSRLDGMPLAIELAAARVRALSVDEIRDSLHDRFRLLTGTTRAAVRRQQTLRASVDWSHALLTESERVLFRRLAAFVGGFDLAAVRAVAGGSEVERYQVLDQLTLLVDKSLVVAESPSGATRYRMLETVRQYALEKLGESGEGDDVRARHRDHYLEVAASLENGAADQQQIDRVAVEIDNLRAVLAWSVDQGDSDSALRLASALVPLWLISGRVREALMAWFDAALGQNEGAAATSAVRARALADRALLHTWAIGVDSATWAEQAVTMAREIGDPALLARALTACGVMTAYGGQDGRQYFDEAFGLARPLGDKWLIVRLLGWQTNLAFMNGDVPAARKFGEEGERLAEVVGDRFTRRQCCNWLGWARTVSGDLAGAIDRLRGVEADAEAAGDGMWWTVSRHMLGLAHAYRGDLETALGIFDESMPILAEMGDLWLGNGNGVHAAAMLAAGEVLEADRLSELCRQQLNANPIHQWMHTYLRAEVALAQGDPAGAHRWADESVSVSSGWYRVLALEARTRVAIARGNTSRPSAMPTRRCRWRRIWARCSEFRISSSCWRYSPARPSGVLKRAGCSAPLPRSGSGWARSGSRCTTPRPTMRSLGYGMPSATTNSTSHTPRAPRCPPRIRSLMRNGAAGSGAVRPPVGRRSPRPSAPSSAWSARDWGTKQSPQGFSSRCGRWRATSPMCIRSSDCHPGSGWCRRPLAIRDRPNVMSGLAEETRWMDATDQAALIAKKEVTPGELLEAAIERIEQSNATLNAVVIEWFEHARAVAADAGLPHGPPRPFQGVPFLLKDLYTSFAGQTLSNGNAALKAAAKIDTADTTLVSRFKAAGLVIAGRTNSPEMGSLPTTQPLAWGPTRNPYALDRTPGGSSGGAAAAVAVGMVPFANASDGGGSIRIPASCCGLVGLKPSQGRITVGPLRAEAGLGVELCVSRTVRDTAGLLDAVRGPGVGDTVIAPAPQRPYVDELGADPGRLRVGLLDIHPRGGFLHPDCVTAVRSAASMLEGLGHIVEPAWPSALADDTLQQKFMALWATQLAMAARGFGATLGRELTADDIEPVNWVLIERARGSAPSTTPRPRTRCTPSVGHCNSGGPTVGTCCSPPRSPNRRCRWPSSRTSPSTRPRRCAVAASSRRSRRLST